MSELAVGSLSGLAANSYVIDIASGSQLTQPGMVLQVVSTAKTDTYSESIAAGAISTNIVTGLTASITPSSASSKILIRVIGHFGHSVADGFGGYLIRRDSTAIGVGDTDGSRSSLTAFGGAYNNDLGDMANLASEFLDSPGTTSEIVYGISLHNRYTDTQTSYVNREAGTTDASRFGRPISTITVMEIAG